jgi:hypothetical protein
MMKQIVLCKVEYTNREGYMQHKNNPDESRLSSLILLILYLLSLFASFLVIELTKKRFYKQCSITSCNGIASKGRSIKISDGVIIKI